MDDAFLRRQVYENGGAVLTGIREVTTPSGRKLFLLSHYDTPGAERDDPHVANDATKTDECYRVLWRHYPDYEDKWKVIYDSVHGYCYIMLPVLLGTADGYFINLKTHEADEKTVRNAGGLLLELYNQSRTRFNLSAFLEARALHSRLVVRSRPIPT